MHLLKTAMCALLLCLAVPAATLAADPTRTVLLVGDSLSSAHRIPVDSGWVSLLRARLRAASATPPVIINASRAGKSMADATGELPGLLAQHHPQVVILELGGNDAFLGASEERLQSDLTRLVDMAHAAGARVAVLGFELPPRLDQGDRSTRLRNAYRHVARDRKVVVLLPSLMAGISDRPALLLDDGVHPSAAAQPLVLENAWGTLKPLLLD